MACDAEIMTTCAPHDVPPTTRSVLGDADLNSSNFKEKFQNLPKISSGAFDLYAGEYIDIISRLWHVISPDSESDAGVLQHMIYHRATSAKNTGSRIRGHVKHLNQTISENEAAFAAMERIVPYHYKFGCQPESTETGPPYECRADFRTLGYTTGQDSTKTVWPWIRELVNQILFNMLPPPESQFRCTWYTAEIKKLVQNIRSELETTFGPLPDMSSVSLNCEFCLRERPRLGRANHHGTCVRCPRVHTPDHSMDKVEYHGRPNPV